MSDNPAYRFDLVRSSDLSSVIALTPVAVSRQLNLVFNKPGTLSLTIPIDSDQASALAMRATGAIVYRRDTPIWSGALTSIVDDAAAGTTALVFTGWREELDHRYVRTSEVSSLSFTNVVGGSIISTLLSTVNAQTDTASTVRPTHLVMGSVSDTQTRTRSYKAGDNYGQLVRELIEIENGLDVRVDPLARTISTFAPTAFNDHADVHFAYGKTPNNLDNVVVTRDGTQLFNRENVTTSGGFVVSVDDPAAIDAASVMLADMLSLSDVSSPTIAGAYANAELVYHRYGIVTYSLTPASLGDVLRPFDDFELGDKVYFSADRGRLQIDRQAVRVFSLNIVIDDNGNEIIGELGVSPS